MMNKEEKENRREKGPLVRVRNNGSMYIKSEDVENNKWALNEMLKSAKAVRRIKEAQEKENE